MYSSLRHNIEKFVKLSDKDWDLLAPHLKIRKIKKNDFFCESGKIGTEIGFVLDGMLRHFYMKEGEEKQLTFILKTI